MVDGVEDGFKPSNQVRPPLGAGAPPVLSRALPFIVAATFFMEYLDTTIIATALPEMARSFAVGPNEISLGMTAYMLTLAVFIPLSGWIADRYGSRTVFAGALVIFTAASVLCGLAPNLTAFTGARVLQGMGGALMVPVGRMIVVRNTEKSRLMKAISTITWPAIVAPVVGPSVGGFITTYFTWHWVFFLNVPFGCGALLAIAKYVPNQRDAERRPLDLVGFCLSGLTLTSLLYGVEIASHREASLLHAAAFVLAALVLGFFSVRHFRVSRSPLLDLTTLRVQTFGVTVLWGAATRIGIEAVPYLSPLLFQVGFGLSAFHSGLLLLATATGNLGMKAFTTVILRRFGFRKVAVVNAAVAGIFIMACGWLRPATPLALMLVVLFIYGLARSLQFTTLATFAYADIDDAQKSSASTLLSVAQQMTIGMGIAFGAVCLRASASLHGAGFDTGAHANALALGDFRWAFAAAGMLVFISIAGYLRLPRDAGHSLSGR